MITDKEMQCIDLSRDLWNAFMELPIQHPADREDFCFHIHAIQNMLLGREGLRQLQENGKGFIDHYSAGK